MTSFELGGTILAAEFALVAWGVQFLMLRHVHRLKARDQAAAGAMLETVATDEPSRRAALADLFNANHGLRDEALEAKVNGYLDREQAFYRAMMRIYVERDGEKLHNLPMELTKILAPLAPSRSAAGQSAADGEREHLELAKAELAAELARTQRTLDQLMKEFKATLGRHPVGSPAPVAVEVSAAALSGTTEIDSPDSPATPAAKEKPVVVEPEEQEALVFDLAQEFEIGELKAPTRVK